jgi:sugar lactone lactonase YvrE
MSTVEMAVDFGAVLGECPVWSDAEQVLYWEDIDGKLIHRLDPATGVNESRSTSGRPGSFVLTNTPGRLLIAMENELIWFDWPSGAEEQWVELEDASTGNRLNDGRCDHRGRYIVGTMFPDTMQGQSVGFLYRVEPDGTSRTIQSDIGVPNGLVFDPDRGRMYFADTFTEAVWLWDYDLDTGERHNGRLFFDYSQISGLPDGACLDADGCYWSASVYGWAVTRITPDGKVDRRIDVPVEKPSMPAFGGANHDTLYVTTIGEGGNVPSQPAKGAFISGGLLAIDAGVQGVSEPLFGGS